MLKYYPLLTEKIIGAIFEIYNRLGYGLKEKLYQQALAEELKQRGLKFARELHSEVYYKDKKIGRGFFDFIVEDKVIVEIKVACDLYKTFLSQVLSYLKHANKRVGIIAVFTKNGVKIKRLVN